MRGCFLLFIIHISLFTFAQEGNQYDVEIKSRSVGDKDSDASFHTIGIKTTLFKNPIKKGENGIIGLDFSYKYINLKYTVESELFHDIEDFHSVGLSLNYLKKINEKWIFIARLNPQLNSNFTGKITGDDFYFNAAALFNYSNSQNSRFTFGLAYTNTLGTPDPIPVISYWRRLNEKWQMSLGFPRTNLTYLLNPKSSFTGYLEQQGFNANISENIQSGSFTGQQIAERISYRDATSGIEYRYRLKKFQIRANGGYTLARKFMLQDSNNDAAHEFDMNKNFSVGLGLSFNF
jgi:hypothetical protein